MTDDKPDSTLIEAERRYFGNRWDDKITLVVNFDDADHTAFLDLPVEQARKLAQDILNLACASDLPGAP
jgi:hypothetical protein